MLTALRIGIVVIVVKRFAPVAIRQANDLPALERKDRLQEDTAAG